MCLIINYTLFSLVPHLDFVPIADHDRGCAIPFVFSSSHPPSGEGRFTLREKEPTILCWGTASSGSSIFAGWCMIPYIFLLYPAVSSLLYYCTLITNKIMEEAPCTRHIFLRRRIGVKRSGQMDMDTIRLK